MPYRAGVRDAASQPNAARGAMMLKRLKQTHPRVDLGRIEILKAFYRGGNHLLGNSAIMERVFPKYVHEDDTVYAERKKRCFYENVFALVVNQLVAGLAQDPAKFDQKVRAQADPSAPVELPAPIDPYWLSVLEDATAASEDGSTQRSLDQVMRDVCCEGLVTGLGWVQADLPATDDPDDESLMMPTSLQEQEELGALRAYLIPWPTECVTDWEERGGKLLWLKTHECRRVALTPDAARDEVEHVWTIWDSDSWTKYSVKVTPAQPMPGDETSVNASDSGDHSFGRVPFVRLDLMSGKGFGTHLHVGDLIESLCRQYFNRQNGEAFQWMQLYFQQLYEFLGPESPGVDTPISDSQTDPARGRRVRAPGRVQLRGKDDRAEFVGPQMGGADQGRNAQQDLRDSILRSTAQMALSQDTSGAMLGRSADSKKQDSVAQEILLGAIGKILLVFVRHTLSLLAIGRAGLDGVPEEPPRVSGYESFDVEDVTEKINNMVLADGISVPSATYQVEAKYQMALAHLGDSLDPEKKAQIYTELRQALTQDQLMMKELSANGMQLGGPNDPNAQPPPGDGDDEAVDQ